MEGNADAVEGGIGGPVSSKVEVTVTNICLHLFTPLHTADFKNIGWRLTNIYGSLHLIH